LVSTTTGATNTAVGWQAGYYVTGTGNTLIGRNAGSGLTTPNQNTFVGVGCGSTITTGANNTIIGAYNGNQGGLDIRTNSNNIVLSDGDGNPRMRISGSNLFYIGDINDNNSGIATMNVSARPSNNYLMQWWNTSGVTTGHINVSGGGTATTYATSSDHRLKENVTADWDATTRLKQLNPVRFNFIADADTTVDGFLAHEVQSVVPEAITGTHNEVDDDGNPVYQGIDQSKLVPLLVKTIQELEARITALENG
jgi:hypothetical protein